MDELSKLFAQMEAQETRLLGIAHCIVPKEEEVPIIEEVPVFVPPPPEPEPSMQQQQQPPQQLPALLLMNAELKENVSGDIQSKPAEDVSSSTEISQQNALDDDIDTNVLITVPDTLPSVILTSLTNTVTSPTIAETLEKDFEVAVTTQVPISNPDENNVDIVMNTQKIENTFNVLTTITANIATIPTAAAAAAALAPATTPMTTVIIQTESNENQSENSVKNLENVTVLNENVHTQLSSTSTVSSLQNDVQITSSTPHSPSSIAEIILESVSKNPEPENYIYETFSPISPVEVSSFQRNEHIVLAEEPPEIPNDAVLTA